MKRLRLGHIGYGALTLMWSLCVAAFFISILNPSSQNTQKQPEKSEPDHAVIRLKNGNTLAGNVISADGENIVIEWQNGTVAFSKSEILSIQWGKVLADDQTQQFGWPHLNNPVLRLRDYKVIDGQILSVTSTHVLVREKSGQKGYIEYEIPRHRVGAIEFDPGRKGEMVRFYAGLAARSPRVASYKKIMRYQGETAEITLAQANATLFLLPEVR